MGELPARGTRRSRGTVGLQLPGYPGSKAGEGASGRGLGWGGEGGQGNPAPLRSSDDTKPDFTTSEKVEVRRLRWAGRTRERARGGKAA